MLGFWAVSAIFIAIALAFLLPPLLKNRNSSGIVARKDLTVTVYQDQFDELENDLKNGVISEEQYKQAKIDLEKNLLEDIDKAGQLDASENTEKNPAINKVSAIIVALVVPVISVGLYNHWGAGIMGIDPEAAPPEVKAEQHKADLDTMLAGLRARLEQNPEDGEGWYMLAKTLQFMKRYGDAVQAYERSLPLGGSQNADVLASYADAIAMAANRTLTDKAIKVLQQAVQLDPGHVKSLWLLGTAAYQKQEYAGAMKYWEQLYNVLPPGSDDANQIAANINEVRNLQGLPPMAMAPAMNQPAAASNSNVKINGTVSLSGAVASKASPEDTVFIFARAAQGPRMPLAIIRAQVKDLPYNFTLDDSLAMNPNMPLSSVAQVVVGARVSKSGNAMPQPGDLQGLSEIIQVGADAPVQLVINEEISGQAATAPAVTTQAANVSIKGSVSLSGAVASKASPEDTVFVFARAAQGPRMPLAIVRKQVKDIPFEFTLDDSMAMNPSLRLSSTAKVVVGARVSRSGNAMPQAGDLEALSDVLDVGSNAPINLIISRVVQ